MGDTIPLPERSCTCHPDDSPPVPCPKKYALRECVAHAAAVSAAARDCRTCKRFYDWEEKVCTKSNKNPCVNGDKHDPLPPVRLWRTT